MDVVNKEIRTFIHIGKFRRRTEPALVKKFCWNVGWTTSMRRGLKAPVTSVRECPAVSGDRHEAAGVRHSGVHTGEKL